MVAEFETALGSVACECVVVVTITTATNAADVIPVHPSASPVFSPYFMGTNPLNPHEQYLSELPCVLLYWAFAGYFPPFQF